MATIKELVIGDEITYIRPGESSSMGKLPTTIQTGFFVKFQDDSFAFQTTKESKNIGYALLSDIVTINGQPVTEEGKDNDNIE